MKGWPIDFVQAATLREFIEELEKKKRVLRATRSWHKFHFEIDTPFVRGPSVTVVIEEEDGVRSIVVLPVRRVFDEEDALGDWPFARWFFPTWRRMLHDGQLVRALDEFYNRLDGNFERVSGLLAETRRTVSDGLDKLVNDVERVRLSIDTEELDANQAYLGQKLANMSTAARRMVWCKLLYVIERYLEYESTENGGGQRQ